MGRETLSLLAGTCHTVTQPSLCLQRPFCRRGGGGGGVSLQAIWPLSSPLNPDQVDRWTLPPPPAPATMLSKSRMISRDDTVVGVPRNVNARSSCICNVLLQRSRIIESAFSSYSLRGSRGYFLFRRPECQLFAQQEIDANPRRLGGRGGGGREKSGCEWILYTWQPVRDRFATHFCLNEMSFTYERILLTKHSVLSVVFKRRKGRRFILLQTCATGNGDSWRKWVYLCQFFGD